MKHRSVLVIGLGVSGRAATRALLATGNRVVATDRRDSEELRTQAEDLAARGADVRLGTDDPRLLDGIDLVVPSPGVPPTNPVVAAATAAALDVWSEPELAWRLSGGRARVVGVTGTNGKTTTTELIAACLNVRAAGNIGTPLVDALAAQPDALVVAELSSFQLHFTSAFRAEVAVCTNVAPDHFDWHGTYPAYAAAKARVWANQRPARDWAVVNADDAGVRGLLRSHPPEGRLIGFTTAPPDGGQVGVEKGWIVERYTSSERVGVIGIDRLQARGPHNLSNALAATAAALTLGRRPGELAEPLAAYAPGAHRLEHIATIDGVAWVNDSKATNPHAAAAALASFGRVVWIAGGLNKGLDFRTLAEPVRRHVAAAVTIGSSGADIAAMTRRLGIATVEAGDLAAAVDAAASLATAGDTVLLAPACASMDQFRDYAARGDAFRGLVIGRRSGTEVVGRAD